MNYKLKDFEEIKITKSENILMIGTLLMVCVLIGGSLNIKVVGENGCKMPVLSKYKFEDEKHFSFFENKPTLWYISDIIPLGRYRLSFGDLLLFLGFLTAPVYFYFIHTKLMGVKNGRRRNSRR